MFFGHGADRYGSWFTDANPEVTIRPTSALSVSLGVRYNHNVADAQWIEEVTDRGTHYVFGHLNQTTVGRRRGQLHAPPDPADPDLRRAVRLGRRLHPFQGAR